jgi:hypothetical protein
MRVLALSLLLLCSLAANAFPTIIDFEEFPEGNVTNPFSSKGYTFSHAYSAGIILMVTPNESTTGQMMTVCDGCAFPTVISMQEENGTLFELTSFDAGYNLASPSWNRSLTVTGTYADNSQIGAVFDSIGGFTETINLGGPGWSNLALVSFSWDADVSSGLDIRGLDNIIVTAVPIPAAVWLFGSGLGLLGWIRRRKAA